MRTTLNLPDDLGLLAKRKAVEEGTTLTSLIVQGLRSRLRSASGPEVLPLSTATGGLRPGVAWERLEPADSADQSYR